MSSTTDMAIALADDDTRRRLALERAEREGQPRARALGEAQVTLSIDYGKHGVSAKHTLTVHDRGPFKLTWPPRWGFYIGRRLELAVPARLPATGPTKIVRDTVRMWCPPKVILAQTGTWEIAELRRAMALARELREAEDEEAA